jgi:hypothetical protein
MNVARTVTGTFQYAAGVSGANNLTLNGTSQVNLGGFVSGSPTYGGSSLLKYNIGGTYGRNGEWLPGVVSGAGYPNHVQLSNNTILDLPNASTSQAFQLAGALTIDSGSTMEIAGTTPLAAPLNVLGALSNAGTLRLSTANGGNLNVAGNVSNSGTYTHNTRTLTLGGNTAATWTGAGTDFGAVVINKTSNVVTLSSALSVQTLTLTSGKVTTTAANLLTVANPAPGAIAGGSLASYINGPLARVLPANLASGSTYLFPVGKPGFNPFELVNPTTTADGPVMVKAEEFDGNSGGTAGTGLSALNTNRYWSASITGGAANFINTAVRLTDSPVTATNVIGKSATVNGIYDSIGGSVAGSTVQSNTITSFSFFNIGTGLTNAAPAITPQAGLSRLQGEAASNATIATVSDTETAAGSLTVTALTVPTGISVTNIVNTNGTIAADLAAECTAATGDNTVVLQVSDGSLTTNANLIINVTANTAPALTYANQSVAPGASLTINPATGPSDDLAIQSIAVQSPGTYTGNISVDNSTGVVSISNAAPEGAHAITIRATDNCGQTTDASFTLNVAPPAPTVGNYPSTSINLGGNGNVTPDAAPTNALQLRVSTSSAFAGLLTVDSGSGIVNVTNAQPAGIYTVTVTASGASGQTTRSFMLTVTTPVNPCTGFKTFVPAAGSPFPAGDFATVAAVGDFNGDGKQDLAVTHLFSNNLTIMLGDGAGGFAATANSPAVGSGQLFVAVGDFNGDGKQDLAATNPLTNKVSVLLGNGAGDFSQAPGSPVAVGTFPFASAVGDIDGDGDQDRVVANVLSMNLSVLLGDGAGGFAAAASSPITVGPDPASVALDDLNGDGKLDIAVIVRSAHNVVVLLGDGLGGFNPAAGSPFSTGDDPTSVAVGDFNSDGTMDLAVSNRGAKTITMLLGDGGGSFNQAGGPPAGIGPGAVMIVAGDFDGDGKLDLATSNNDSNDVTVLSGDGSGGFAGFSGSPYPVGSSPRSVAVGDFNGDGRLDLVTANSGSNDVSVLLPGCGTNLPIITATSGLSRPQGTTANVTIASVSDPDQAAGTLGVTVSSDGSTFSGFAFSNDVSISNISVDASGNVTADMETTCDATDATFTLKVRDQDNLTATATLDVTVTANTILPVLGAYANAGVNLGSQVTITPDAAPANAAALSVQASSGFSGLLTLNQSTGTVQVTNAAPAGTHTITITAAGGTCASPVTKTFTLTVNTVAVCNPVFFNNAPDVSAGSNPASGAIGDFNGDGKQDLAIANNGSSNVSIRLGNGAGGFSGSTNLSVGASPQALAAGDFNGDGNQDLAITSSGSPNVSIRLGNGTGNFSNAPDLSLHNGTVSIVVGDFNGDGKQDLAISQINTPSLFIRLGDGAGNFSSAPDVSIGASATALAIGDFNGDGKQDLAVGKNTTPIAIRLGDGAGNFSSAADVILPKTASNIVIGDFNADGNQDIAAAVTANSSVEIRLGDGAGGFTGTTSVSTGSNSNFVAIGDFNGDGKQDLAGTIWNTVKNTPGFVGIRLGDGAGNFSGTTDFGVGTNPSYIGVGDFNGDGNQDFFTANSFTNNASVRLRACPNSAPVITPATGLSLQQGGAMSQSTIATVSDNETGAGSLTVTPLTVPTGISVTNIVNTNGAISANLAAGCNAATGNNTVVLQVSDGSLTTNANLILNVTANTAPTLTYSNQSVAPGGSLTINPATGPKDDSGIQPIALQSQGTYTGTISVSDKTGVISISNAAPAGSHTITIRATDDCGLFTDASFILNVPLPPTLGNYGPASVNLSGNTTVSPDASPTGASSLSVSTSTSFLGELTGDPLTGVVRVTNAAPAGTYPVKVMAAGAGGVTTRTFTLTVNTSPACSTIALANAADVSAGMVPRAVGIGDFNNDGKQDLAFTNGRSTGPLSETVAIRLGDGAGNFSGSTNISVADPFAFTVSDFNGDGNQDLAVLTRGSRRVEVLFGDGIGNLVNGSFFLTFVEVLSIAAGDFNGDGREDLAVTQANNDWRMVLIWLNDGTGRFQRGQSLIVGAIPDAIVVGDFNGDGKQDLAIANRPAGSDPLSNTVSIRLGDGAGGFSGKTNLSVVGDPTALVLGDFNGDGKQDLTVTGKGDSIVSIRLGDGAGNFSSASDVSIAQKATEKTMAIGDFNADGKQDLLIGTNTTAAIRLGDGAGNFSGPTQIDIGDNPASLAVGDFDGDGKQDFVAASAADAKLSVRLRSCSENTAPGITPSTGLVTTRRSSK